MEDRRDGRWEPLVELARLERGIRAVETTWLRFREAPSREGLGNLREELGEALQRADHLRGAIVGTGGEGRRGERSDRAEHRGPSRPEARHLIEASRALDRLLWQIASDWHELRDRVSVRGLGSLTSRLRLAREQAATLRRALESIPPDFAHRSFAALAGTDPDTSWELPPASGRPELEIESLLWRIQSDWQHLRRGPAPDRVGVLEDELEAAATRVQQLERLLDVETAGRAAAGSDRREGRRAGVHFPPYRDGFTGAYNREGFDALAGAELKRCRRYGRPFGLLLLEVRPVELSRLASEVEVLQQALRAYDLLARYVDRLLVAGLPESGAVDTRRVAGRILRALREEGMAADIVRLAYATLPGDGNTLSDLMRIARRRLEQPHGESGPT